MIVYLKKTNYHNVKFFFKKKLLFNQKANKNGDEIFTGNQRVTNIEK